MKLKAIKLIFFITIIILIIVSIFILYINKNESTVEVEGKKIDNVTSNNLSFGLANYDNLNPHISQNQDVQYVSKLIYKDLIGISEEFELIPSLAKEWSKIATKTYIVKLNENEYWHNGNKFTSKDVEFTINNLKSEISNSIYKENVKNIERVEIIDDYTLKIYTYEEEEFFEYNLCMPMLFYNSENDFIGTGKYKVREINGKYIILEEVNQSNISRKIKINLYNSYSELYSAFSQGKVDIITTSNIDFNNYVGTIGLKEERIKGRELTYLLINTSEDINIRRAIKSAINKEEIIYNVFNNKHFCANNLLNNGSYLGEAGSTASYNLNNAKKYIMSSGWKYNNGNWSKNGNILSVDLLVKQNNEKEMEVAQILKTQLEKIGIKIKIMELSYEDYNYRLKNNEYDIILCNDTLSIAPKFYQYLNNSELKAMVNKIGNIENKEILKKTYSEILKEYEEESFMICLTFDSIVILHSTNVKGNFTGNWYNIFYNIDTWYKEL